MDQKYGHSYERGSWLQGEGNRSNPSAIISMPIIRGTTTRRRDISLNLILLMMRAITFSIRTLGYSSLSLDLKLFLRLKL